MRIRLHVSTLMSLGLLIAASVASAADSQDEAVIAAVRKRSESMTTAFNSGKVDELSATFSPTGELIDEIGTVYQGQPEIKNLLTTFFEKFPGAKLTRDIESIRPVGPVAIEEGTRTIATKDGSVKSQFRYLSVWVKGEHGWQLASFRDFADDPVPTPHERLESIAWLVGDWMNEGADAKVSISYRWSDDKNYLLVNYQINPKQGSPRKSTQRIGWDPSIGKIRSWLFDADGGFAEGIWTVTDDDIVIKSSSVNPDGGTASATMTVTIADNNRFTITGADRIVDDNHEPDFEVTVVRRSPAAAK
ncbi:MAG: nuclear transport factor 2 family protein [Pirellulales bacterium]|nr:nuclear transport factor 2 family protein [Pirellulales bacterium]